MLWVHPLTCCDRTCSTASFCACACACASASWAALGRCEDSAARIRGSNPASSTCLDIPAVYVVPARTASDGSRIRDAHKHQKLSRAHASTGQSLLLLQAQTPLPIVAVSQSGRCCLLTLQVQGQAIAAWRIVHRHAAAGIRSLMAPLLLCCAVRADRKASCTARAYSGQWAGSAAGEPATCKRAGSRMTATSRGGRQGDVSWGLH